MNIRIRVVLTLGICLLALESLEGEQTGAPQIDPSKYKFLLGACEGRTSSYRNVYGVVSREVDLSVDNTARALLELGAALGQEQCPRSAGFGNITVYLYHGDPGTFSADKFDYRTNKRLLTLVDDTYGDNSYGTRTFPRWRYAALGRNYSQNPTGFNWFEYTNHAKEVKEAAEAREMRAAVERRRAAEQRIRERLSAEAAATAEKARVAKTEAFMKRAGTKQIIRLGDLCQNPFPYQGKIVVFPLLGMWQWEAASPISAAIQGFSLACGFAMNGIPPNILTRQFNGAKVLAVKVIGKQQGVLVVQYVHHEQCADGGCRDFAYIE